MCDDGRLQSLIEQAAALLAELRAYRASELAKQNATPGTYPDSRAPRARIR